jgi:hypothetical protein
MTSKTNKYLSIFSILSLFLLIPFLGFSQTEIEKEQVKVEALSIEITIDSAEELDTTFKEQDLEELFEMTDADEEVTFILNCTFEAAKDNLKGHLKYTVKGKTNEKEKLFNDIKKAKATALKFYTLKNRK